MRKLWPIAFLVLLFFPPWWISQPSITRLCLATAIFACVHVWREQRLGVVQWWFLGWLAWAAVGCLASEAPGTSLMGSYFRFEGLVTWAALTLAAWLYWRTCLDFTDLRTALVIAFAYIYVVILAANTDDIYRIGERVFPLTGTYIALGALAAVGGTILVCHNWLYALLVMPTVLWCQNRAAFLALLAGFLAHKYLTMSRRRLRWVVPWVAAFVIITAFTGLGKKFLSISGSTAFTGARAQWVLQAHALSLECPITGFGLDTLAGYLRNPTGPSSEAEGRPDKRYMADRCHNVLFDLLLQTGWIGLTLALFTLGAAVHVAMNNPTPVNATALACVVAWCVFGLFNPPGYNATLIMLVAIFALHPSPTPAHPNQAGT